MRLFKHTIFIDRPREAVFDFFINFPESHRWRAFVREMRPHGALVPGTKIDVILDMLGEERKHELVIVTCERPSLWRHRSTESDYNGVVEYTFEPQGSGTVVTMSMRAKPASIVAPFRRAQVNPDT